MREAKLVLPVLDNDGEPLAIELDAIRAKLLDAFGGFTETSGQGGWRAPDGRVLRERVAVFLIAAPYGDPAERVKANFTLADIVEQARRACQQESVYCVGFDGEARFYTAEGVSS